MTEQSMKSSQRKWNSFNFTQSTNMYQSGKKQHLRNSDPSGDQPRILAENGMKVRQNGSEMEVARGN